MFARRLTTRSADVVGSLTRWRRSAASLSYVQRIKLLQAVRENDDRCRELMVSGQFLPFLKRRPLVCSDPAGSDRGARLVGSDGPLTVTSGPSDSGTHVLRWLNYKELRRVAPADDPAFQYALLHMSSTGQPCFAVALPDGADVPAIDGARFVDPRIALFMLPWQQAHTMSHGFAVLRWLTTTKFCPSCGAELSTRAAGHVKRCCACQSVQYPLTPPVGIVMVTDAAGTRTLLVRQQRHPPGMYSCIAGFLEPGETIESCVCREIAEEVGLEVTEVRYAASQHWPFNGSSLMVGCYAITEQMELDIDRDELEDARWFSVEEVHAAYERIVANPAARLKSSSSSGSAAELWVPPDGAIAHRLIRAWLAEHGLPT